MSKVRFDTLSRKLVVHIGAPKCGSTAIQMALYKHTSELEALGVKYPNFNNEGFGWQAARGLTGGNGWYAAFDPNAPGNEQATPDAAKASFINLIDQVEPISKEFPIVVISNELLQRICHEEFFWKKLSDFRANQNCAVEVILYLRDPFSMVNAFYSERVKRGQTLKTFNDYILGTTEILPPIYYNMAAMLNKAKEHSFSPTIFRYEDTGLNSAVHFFSHLIPNWERNFEIQRIEVNKSLAPVELDFFRGVHSVSPQLGMILCWERTDVFYGKIDLNLEGSDKLLDFSLEAQEHLRDKFMILKEEFDSLLAFSGEVSYELDESKFTPSLSFSEKQSRQNLYQIGAFVGGSYKAGYLDWTIGNLSRSQNVSKKDD